MSKSHRSTTEIKSPYQQRMGVDAMGMQISDDAAGELQEDVDVRHVGADDERRGGVRGLPNESGAAERPGRE